VKATVTASIECTMIGTVSFDGLSQGALWTGTGGLAPKLQQRFINLGFSGEVALEISFTIGLLFMVGLVSEGLARSVKTASCGQSTSARSPYEAAETGTPSRAEQPDVAAATHTPLTASAARRSTADAQPDAADAALASIDDLDIQAEDVSLSL
jgi:hypothetical protein